jgi:hypothetical protein
MNLRHLCQFGTGKPSYVRFTVCLAGLLLLLRITFSREGGLDAVRLSEHPEPCPEHILAGIYPLNTHAYTTRSFKEHVFMHPPFLNFSHNMERKPF